MSIHVQLYEILFLIGLLIIISSNPQSTSDLQALRDTAIIKSIPNSMRGDYEAVLEIVLNLAKKVAPDIDSSGGETFFAKVLNSVSYYFSWVEPKNSEGIAVVLYGHRAIVKAFEAMTTTMASEAKSQVRLSHLDDFMVYKWLLTAAQKTLLSSWVTTVFTGSSSTTGTKPVGIPRSSGSAPSGSKGQTKKNKTDTNVMSFFD